MPGLGQVQEWRSACYRLQDAGGVTLKICRAAEIEDTECGRLDRQFPERLIGAGEDTDLVASLTQDERRKPERWLGVLQEEDRGHAAPFALLSRKQTLPDESVIGLFVAVPREYIA
jgi:hypothetical protein